MRQKPGPEKQMDAAKGLLKMAASGGLRLPALWRGRVFRAA
jgi:hypothetical protein